MKKFLIILLAAVTAFLLIEIFSRTVLNFPGYGIEKHITGITTLKNRGEIYKPYSEYMNNENGYKVFRRNNAGFPGSKININDSSKYILVLGNSFVEGYQVEPDLISTSVLQSKLNTKNPRYQAVNLGASGHDIYDLWFRANYFEKEFPHAAVILIITENGLINRTSNLNFTLPSNFGMPVTSFKTKTLTLLRNSSSFINLVSTALKYSFTRKNDLDRELINKNTQGVTLFDTIGIGSCLKEFNKKFGDKFIAVSVIGDSFINNSFNEFCKLNNIQYTSFPLLTPEFEIKQSGHLTEAGNQKLGELLYESFYRYHKK